MTLRSPRVSPNQREQTFHARRCFVSVCIESPCLKREVGARVLHISAESGHHWIGPLGDTQGGQALGSWNIRLHRPISCVSYKQKKEKKKKSRGLSW